MGAMRVTGSPIAPMGRACNRWHDAALAATMLRVMGR